MSTTNGHAQELLLNALLSRERFFQRAMDGPNRDINQECGYPETTSLQPKDFREMYDREGIAARVVNLFPRGCWKQEPTIYEVEDAEQETEFEQAIKDVGKMLMGRSWLESQEQCGNPLFHYLQRLDERSGIGRFGVLLLGLDDGKPLDQPVEGFIEGTAGGDSSPPQRTPPPAAGQSTPQGQPRKLLYLRVLDESLVTIDEYEVDPKSPRYGQPKLYSITLTDHSDTGFPLAAGSTTSANVHWHRIIHVADNRGSSEVFGTPRMLPVWNRLQDLRKLLGGSGEMFWKGACPAYVMNLDPKAVAESGMNLGDEATRQNLKDEAHGFMNTLQRMFAAVGVSIQMVAPQVADPSHHVRVQLEALCITLDVPLRIFLGSERGELASSQDTHAWNDSIRLRRAAYVTPCIVAPTIDRLISCRVLPAPQQYYVDWPDLEAPSEADRANVAKVKIEALAKYVAGGVSEIFPPLECLTILLGMSQEEAEAVMEAAEEEQAKLEAEQEELDAQIEKELAARGMGQPGGMNSFPTKDAGAGQRNGQPNGQPAATPSGARRGLPDNNTDERFP